MHLLVISIGLACTWVLVRLIFNQTVMTARAIFQEHTAEDHDFQHAGQEGYSVSETEASESLVSRSIRPRQPLNGAVHDPVH